MGRQVIAKAQPVEAITIGRPPEYLAYFLDGSDLRMWSVNNEQYGVELATTGSADSLVPWRTSRVFHDSSGRIGDDSLIWSRGVSGDTVHGDEGSNGVYVADIRNGVTYSLTEGFDGDVVMCCYLAGFIYVMTWLSNHSAETNTIRLYRVHTDLEADTLVEIATLTPTVAEPGRDPLWVRSGSFGVAGSSIFGTFRYDYGVEITLAAPFGNATCWFPIGDTANWSSLNQPTGVAMVGQPYGGTLCIGGINLESPAMHNALFPEPEVGGFVGWQAQISDSIELAWFPEEEFELDFEEAYSSPATASSLASTYLKPAAIWNPEEYPGPYLYRVCRWPPDIEDGSRPLESFWLVPRHPEFGWPTLIYPL